MKRQRTFSEMIGPVDVKRIQLEGRKAAKGFNAIASSKSRKGNLARNIKRGIMFF